MKIIIFFVILLIVLGLVSKNWKTTVKVMSGWGIMELISFFYDFPFWIWLQHHFGLLMGSLYGTIGAFIFNFGLLVWYQWSGEDWLGVNVFEQIKKEGSEWVNKINSYHGWFLKVLLFFPVYVPSQLFRLVIWSLNKTELTTFLIFSVLEDSFVTTVFLRHGKFGKLNFRDIKIFISSTIFGCFVWSVFNWFLTAIYMFGSHLYHLLFV